MRLFQKNNGFWYVQVDRNHKRALGTKDPEEAVLAFNLFQSNLLKEKIRILDEGKRISLKIFRDKYSKSRKGYSPDTLRGDSQAFKNLVAGFGEGALLLSITPERIAEWRENLLRRVSLGSVKTWTGHLEEGRVPIGDADERDVPEGPQGKNRGGDAEPVLIPDYFGVLIAAGCFPMDCSMSWA